MAENNRAVGNRTLAIALMVLLFLPLSFFIYFFYLHETTPSPLKHLPMLSGEPVDSNADGKVDYYTNIRPLPEFSFMAHNGETITRDSLLGKVVIADFFFTTCPGICPRMSSNMKLLQDSILKNKNTFHSTIQLVSHTVNPTVDSVPVLAEYATKMGVNESIWWLVTGDKDSLFKLSTGFYKLPAMDVSDDSTLIEPFVHSERFVLLDREGVIRGYYDGTDSAAVEQLYKDLIVLDIVNYNQDRREKRESLKNADKK